MLSTGVLWIFLIVNHMEPDHAGSIRLLRQQYPDVRIVGNKQTFGMLNGYHGISTGLYEVKEGDTLSVGRHQLSFYMAPMVHWPEVMVTYDSTDKILFSADAFGTYGTLDGGVIDSEMNVEHYWEEMLRYYSNIVGKYGNPVQRALQKLSALDIRNNTVRLVVVVNMQRKAIDIYDRMSRYEGEEGVTIVYRQQCITKYFHSFNAHVTNTARKHHCTTKLNTAIVSSIQSSSTLVGQADKYTFHHV